MNSPRSVSLMASAALALLSALVLAGCAGGPRWEVGNPYAGVDWERHRPHKANLHTHTTQSDGREAPEAAIDLYAGLGYTVLALTDHDTRGPGNDREHPERRRTTWPWEAFGRDPAALGMVAVQGNEVSRKHHIGSYFIDYGDPDIGSEEEALAEIGRRGGLAVLFHPGRYEHPVEWYVEHYRAHPHLVGLEVCNQNDRYPNDRDTWDAILSALAAGRPVWGFANDDMHNPERHLGRSWNVLWLPELTAEQVRAAMETGTFFYAHAPGGHGGPMPPEVRAVAVDARRGTIRVESGAAARIEWISGGAVVHEGAVLRLARLRGHAGYVRAVLHAAEGGAFTGTQPFFILDLRQREDPRP